MGITTTPVTSETRYSSTQEIQDDTIATHLLRGVLLVRLLGDLSRLVVADVRVQRRDQHQARPHQLVDAAQVRLDAHQAVVHKRHARVRQQQDALPDLLVGVTEDTPVRQLSTNDTHASDPVVEWHYKGLNVRAEGSTGLPVDQY
eukprot:220503-Prorocentrum_minimum.AAC.1